MRNETAFRGGPVGKSAAAIRKMIRNGERIARIYWRGNRLEGLIFVYRTRVVPRDGGGSAVFPSSTQTKSFKDIAVLGPMSPR